MPGYVPYFGRCALERGFRTARTDRESASESAAKPTRRCGTQSVPAQPQLAGCSWPRLLYKIPPVTRIVSAENRQENCKAAKCPYALARFNMHPARKLHDDYQAAQEEHLGHAPGAQAVKEHQGIFICRCAPRQAGKNQHPEQQCNLQHGDQEHRHCQRQCRPEHPSMIQRKRRRPYACICSDPTELDSENRRHVRDYKDNCSGKRHGQQLRGRRVILAREHGTAVTAVGHFRRGERDLPMYGIAVFANQARCRERRHSEYFRQSALAANSRKHSLISIDELNALTRLVNSQSVALSFIDPACRSELKQLVVSRSWASIAEEPMYPRVGSGTAY